MEIDEIRQYIHTHLTQQPGTKIQYGHPSPRFWQTFAPSLEEVAAMRRPDRKLFLYLHIPFCPQTDPPACGFCLFSREDFTGYPAVKAYLETMRRELEMYARVFGGEELACVYIGGGTPNILKPKEYGTLMGWVRDCFRLAPGAEVTLEGVPQLFGQDRLQAMAEAGVTRVSIGAQQLKDELLQYSGRQQSAEQVLEGIQAAHRLGMVVNVDLICGWFDQVESDLEDDLKAICAYKPESIVVHPLTLAGPSHFAQMKARLPSPEETCRTFLRGRRYLEENGYWGSSYVDYMLKDPPTGPEEVQYLRLYREMLKYDRLGVGYGANSLFAGTDDRPGWTWRNLDQLQPYDERIDAGRLPVLEGFHFTPTDLRLLYVLKGIEGTPFLTAEGYARDFGEDLQEAFGDYFQVLQEYGWLEVNSKGEHHVKGEGLFYMPMIQRCISNDRNDELKRAHRATRSLENQVYAV